MRSSVSSVQRQYAGACSRAVRLARDVVAGRAAAQREAAVAAARTLRDAARVVDAHAQPALGEPERGRAAGDAGADDRDVDAAVGVGRAASGLDLRASRVATGAMYSRAGPVQDERDGRRRRTRPRDRPARARRARAATSPAPSPVSADELVGARGQELEERRASPRRPAPARSRSETSTSRADVSGDAPSLSSAFVPAESARRDLAGHREHLASLLEREVGGDQRAAPLARLDDDRRRAEPGDDAVARRKAPRRGLDAGRVLGDDEPASRDAPRELGVRGRIVAVDAAAEHGDRRAARVERAAVRLGVDAAREAADDDEPGRARARAPRLRATEAP